MDIQWLYSTITIQNILTALGLFFLLSNLKVLPGAWHIRIIKGIFTQLHSTPTPPPGSTPHITNLQNKPTPHLFGFLTTTTYNIPLECDYNGHKSNSTFFTDLDINRTQLLANVFKRVLSASFINRGIRDKQLTIALGGTCCLYRREIFPFQRFEVWSRVLSWDEKWVYIVSYFVRDGVKRKSGMPGQEDIFASSIARYVFKDGGKTVKPVEVLKETEMMPSPSDVSGDGDNGDKWTWMMFEEERQRGMEIGKLLTGLEGLSGLLDPGRVGMLVGSGAML